LNSDFCADDLKIGVGLGIFDPGCYGANAKSQYLNSSFSGI